MISSGNLGVDVDVDPRGLDDKLRTAEPVHVQGPRWTQGPRAASLRSTSTPRVHDQVDVDDHDDGDCSVTEDELDGSARARHPQPGSGTASAGTVEAWNAVDHGTVAHRLPSVRNSARWQLAPRTTSASSATPDTRPGGPAEESRGATQVRTLLCSPYPAMLHAAYRITRRDGGRARPRRDVRPQAPQPPQLVAGQRRWTAAHLMSFTNTRS